jgi:hypothetical protein
MGDCCNIEEIGKCRFLFYDKSTGLVLDIGSGGGAGNSLTGNSFIIWRYNDITAPDRIGCIPFYFNKLGANTKPKQVDLSKVADFEAKSRAWNTAKAAGDATATHAAFEDM